MIPGPTPPGPAPAGRHRKPRGQGPLRRGEILDAAKRLFVSEGVAHATMRRIAGAVGVSPTALYVYFPDREAILRAIAEATFAELLTVLEVARHGEGTPAARLEAGLRAYVAFGRARPDEYRLTFAATRASVRGGPRERIEDADRAFAILEGCVAELTAADAARPAATLAVAETVWGCLHGLTTLLIDMPNHCDTPPERLVDTMVSLVLGGLGAAAAI